MRKSLLVYALLSTATLILGACTSTGTKPQILEEMAQVPISDQPSGTSSPGKFVWHDLITPDLESAAEFYQSLFGWELDYRSGYAVVRNRGRLIGRIIEIAPREEEKDSLWVPTVSVADISAVIDRVEAGGGEVLKGPSERGRRGEAILIRDSQGANIVLLESKEGDPVDDDARVGDWLWDEVWTTTPEQTETFYSSVLEYDQLLPGESYDVFMKDGVWRAGMRHVGNEMDNRLWVPVVRVGDPGAIVQRVSALAGYVLFTPEEVPGKRNAALIADPTGALLIVQHWTAESAPGRSAQ